MRAIATSLLLIASSLVAYGCAGGPQDSDARLAEACERQIAEVAEEEGGTPTAKSTEERLEEETLVKCAGQEVKVVAADAEGEDKDGETEGEAGEGEGDDAATNEDPGSGGDEAAPAELDPEARTLFADTCGSCHTLADAETEGEFGPVLDDTELDSTGVREKIETGGGGMPPDLLEGEEADAVAEYVAAAAAAE